MGAIIAYRFTKKESRDTKDQLEANKIISQNMILRQRSQFERAALASQTQQAMLNQIIAANANHGTEVTTTETTTSKRGVTGSGKFMEHVDRSTTFVVNKTHDETYDELPTKERTYAEIDVAVSDPGYCVNVFAVRVDSLHTATWLEYVA